MKNTFFVSYMTIFGPFRWMRVACYLCIAITTATSTAIFLVQVITLAPEVQSPSAGHSFASTELALAVPYAVISLAIDIVISELLGGTENKSHSLQQLFRMQIGCSSQSCAVDI